MIPWFNNLKMRNKILILVLSVAIMSVAGMTAYSYINMSRSQLNLMGDTMGGYTEQALERALGIVSGSVNALEALALSPTLIEAVMEANESHSGRSQADIDAEVRRIDAAWIQEDAAAQELVDGIVSNEASEYLRSFAERFTEQVEVFVTDVQGLNVAMSNRTSDYLQADEAWWRQAYANGSGDLYVSRVTYDESAGTWGIEVGIPLRDPRSRQVIGVLRGTIDITVIFEALSQIAFGETGHVALFERDGTILYHSDEKRAMQQATGDIAALIAAGENGWWSDVPDLQGDPSLVALRFMSGDLGESLGWVLESHQKMTDLTGPLQQTLINSLLLAGVIVLALMGAGTLLARTITQPLDQTVVMIQEMRKGHLSNRLQLARGDEIGVLAGTMDVFADTLQNSTLATLQRVAAGDLSVTVTLVDEQDEIGQALKATVRSLQALLEEANLLTEAAVQGHLGTRGNATRFQNGYRAIVEGINATLDAVIGPLNIAAGYVDQIARGIIPEPITTVYQGDFEILKANLNILSAQLREMLGGIQQAAGDLSTAATEILAATTQQAAGATEQSASITQTSTTVDEVKVISEQAIARAREVSDSSRRTIEVSRTGRSSVEETITSMNQIKERVEGIAENILALSDKTQQIGEITATVNDIASQSNMLALNASVEAARAGEHGKGFAVVAAEVRSLAEQSKRATAQVRTILNDIQNAINASVMVTEEGTKVVDDGVNRAAQAREAIEQLATAITQSAQVAGQVAAGGQQQASGVEQIALAMTNIQQAMQQNLAGTRQAESAAQNLNGLARTLNDTVRRYTIEGNGHG